ncbi:protein C2-DOMAIN ABA-RELATED 7-like [Chenopodium quinoa]|uniref:protein C2-DOMAIN ABA-RELATED 7-like n=1 Tax=Chenopodium quinoa TaxID=63459 RepID=UPI000B7809B3|nr:protein C2-DOMAIN ABA-RELATED 7-like [Chenopodium quinoa]
MNILGALKITVKKGIDLKVCDAFSSDPYVVITSGSQKLKTRVIKNNCNPEWNDVLTLSVTDPDMPITLNVFDKDRFSRPDKMGDANVDIKSYIECMQMGIKDLPIGTAVKKIQPDESNCLDDESKVVWTGKGKMVQEMTLKLQNVEKGKIQIKIEWLDLPGCKGLPKLNS